MSRLTAIAFTNSRNQQLVGVLHHGVGKTPRPCLIACHGYTETKMGDRSRFLVDFAQYAVKHNFSVFRFDFAGCGDSEGEFVDLTLETELEDLQAAIDTVSTIEGIDANKIGVFGQCLGAVTAIRAGYRDKRIYKVVAWAPFADFNSALLGLVGEEAFEVLKQGENAEFIYRGQLFQCGWRILENASELDMFNEVARLCDPLLVIHGTEDEIVSIQQVEELVKFSERPAAERKLAVVRGAHHFFPLHRREIFELAVKHFSKTTTLSESVQVQKEIKHAKVKPRECRFI